MIGKRLADLSNDELLGVLRKAIADDANLVIEQIEDEVIRRNNRSLDSAYMNVFSEFESPENSSDLMKRMKDSPIWATDGRQRTFGEEDAKP